MVQEKKSTKIYEAIKADILCGGLDRRSFVNAGEIAEQYQVSKAPVRDALQVLCDQGYLVSYPRKGYMVNIFDREEANQIQNVRRHVEKYCVELAIEHATDEEIKSLGRYTKRNLPEQGNRYQSELQFHVRLAEIGGNEYLVEIVKNLAGKIAMANIDTASDLCYYEKVVEALLDRNLEEAIQYIEADIESL